MARQKRDRFSDSAIAEQAVGELLEDRFIHVQGLGWLAWDERRWREVPEKTPLEALRQWLKVKMSDAAQRAAEGTGTTEAVKNWFELQYLHRMQAVLKLAKGMVSVHPDQLDSSPDLLNVLNGVVVLNTGDLIPHNPRLYLTKLAGAAFDPLKLHEDWNYALAALPHDVLSWLQVRYGQAITGHMTPDDRVVIQQGGGANGKSTILTGIAAALGDYFFQASDKILMASHSGAHTTDLADLRGSRFVAIEETPEAGRLDVVRLKKVAGTERITARKMREDNVSFQATHTLFVNTNYPPMVAETDSGTWRRLLLVVFPYTFTRDPVEPHERKGDPGLRERLRSGSSGQRDAVLAWLVEGATRWYAEKKVMPAPPASVLEHTEEWRGRTDHVAAFWGDHLDADPDSYVYGGDLIWMFNQFMRQHGNAPLAESTFIRRFAEHSLTAGALVVKRRMRQSATSLTLSRPYGGLDPFARLPGVPSGQIQAWVGLRFRGATDEAPVDVWDQTKGRDV